MRFLSIMALVLGFLLPSVAQANLISNGNFINCVDCGSGAFVTKNGGSTDITNWLVTGHSVDLILSYWQAPPVGGNSVDLSGNNPGGVSQTFATVAGQQYLVSFYLSGNPDNKGVDTLKEAAVSVGISNQNVAFNTQSFTKTNMGWVLQSFVFSAIANSSTLSFAGSNLDGAYGAAIGGVSVTEAPEPATIMLMAIGLLFMFGYTALRGRNAA
jgi:choice-of-anchor C domain-containing protein